MSEPRKAHVKRVLFIDGTDRNRDIFIDLLRIDGMTITYRGLGDGQTRQGLRHTLKWNDDENQPNPNTDDSNADPQHENANPRRKTKKLKIKNPDEPDQVNNLWIIDRTKFAMPRGVDTGVLNQLMTFVFNNTPLLPAGDAPASKRTVKVLKVVNNDLDGFEMLNADDTSKIIDWNEYRQKLLAGVKDDGQRLNVEIVEDFTIKVHGGPGNAPTPNPLDGIRAQGLKYVLTKNKDDVELMFDTADPAAVDQAGDPAVLRLDPFQFIVNVGWGDAYRQVTALFVEAGDFVWTMRFETPKTFHTDRVLNDPKKPVSPPKYNGDLAVPGVASPNASQVYRVYDPFGAHNQTGYAIESGDLISALSPSCGIDYRGYMTLTGFKWEKFSQVNSDKFYYLVFIDPSLKMYFDYKGKMISKKDIPDVPKQVRERGLHIAGDDQGSIYFKYSTGLIKYDKNGGKVWSVGYGADTAYFEKDNSVVRLSFAFGGRSDVATTEWYDLNGGLTNSVTIIDDLVFSGATEVSRRGNFFAFYNDGTAPFQKQDGIKAWNPHGDKLWSTECPTNTVGTQYYTSVTAYGEDYLICTWQNKTQDDSAFDPVGTHPDSRGLITLTQKFQYGWDILSAHSGEVVATNTLGESYSQVLDETYFNGTWLITEIHTTYTPFDIRVVRSAYWN